MDNRNVGEFSIDRVDIESMRPEIRAVMAKCVILRAEMLYHKDRIQYVAYCDDFDEVAVGDKASSYDLDLKTAQFTLKG